jgi:tetratricopeptide (TPR) repeat protein
MLKNLLKLTFALTVVFVISITAMAKDTRYLSDKDASGNPTALMAAGSEEVDLVETMAGYRNSYRASLEQMKKYYQAIGDDTKRVWAEKELKSLDSIPWYRYLSPGDTATAGMYPSDAIPAADALYAEGVKLYKSAKALIVFTDKKKMQQALRKFEEVFQKYPTSDKIDDAVYKAARIYEHFKDYEIAVLYYQRNFQWNPNTKYSSRYKAATLLDYKLRKRKEALPIYQESLKKESLTLETKELVQMRVNALITSEEKSGIQKDLKHGRPVKK